MGMSWQQRAELDAQATDSDRLMTAAFIDRIDAFCESTRCTFELTVYAYWLIHDDHDEYEGTYCLGCAQALVAKLDERDGWTPASDSDGWKLSGGYDPEHGPKCCDECGRSLRYVIDDSHAPDELHHFSSLAGQKLDTPADVLAVHELASWAQTHGPSRLAEIEEVVAIMDRVDMDAFDLALPAAIAEEKEHTRRDWEAEAERERVRDQAWQRHREAENAEWTRAA